MTRKHAIFFFFWKIKMYLKGYKKNAPVQIWSDDKNQNIKGYVQGFTGDSISVKKFGFDVYIKWLEPLQGNDSRVYTWGYYSEKQLKKQKVKLL